MALNESIHDTRSLLEDKDFGSSRELIDFMQLIQNHDGNLDNSVRRKRRVLLVDFTQTQSLKELSRVSRCADSLLPGAKLVLAPRQNGGMPFKRRKKMGSSAGGGSNKDDVLVVDREEALEWALSSESDKRIVFVVDNNTDLGQLKKYVSKCSDILFYCDTAASLERGLVEKLVKILIEEAKITKSEPKHLILDFMKDSLVFTDDRKMLGFLNSELVFQKPEDVAPLRISVPSATELELHYRVIDNLIDSVLEKGGDSLLSPQRALERLLEGFEVYFPDLERIGFVESSNNGWICNEIDMSVARLSEFRSKKIDIGTIFQIHSLKRWQLPVLDFFSGQLFNFEVGPTQDQSIDLVQLESSLEILNELTRISNEGNQVDDNEFELFPSNVRKGRVINWAIQELNPSADFDVEKNLLPIMKFRSDSLETLDLRPLITGDGSSLLVCGIYTPNLKELNLLTDQLSTGSYPKYEIYQSINCNRAGWKSASGVPFKKENRTKLELLNDNGLNLINPVFFLCMNDLGKCERITVLTCHKIWPNYMFNIGNLRKVLPRISLEKSFPSYVSDAQQFVTI